MAKLIFHQSSVSHNPSEIIWICSRNISLNSIIYLILYFVFFNWIFFAFGITNWKLNIKREKLIRKQQSVFSITGILVYTTIIAIFVFLDFHVKVLTTLLCISVILLAIFFKYVHVDFYSFLSQF